MRENVQRVTCAHINEFIFPGVDRNVIIFTFFFNQIYFVGLNMKGKFLIQSDFVTCICNCEIND